MQIRSFNPLDESIARYLHTKFFIDEFEFPIFMKMHGAVTVENEGKVILVGGIRPIAETVAITNKDVSVRERREALIKYLQFCLYTGANFKYDQIHAFVQDVDFIEHLLKFSFRETKGKSLVCDI